MLKHWGALIFAAAFVAAAPIPIPKPSQQAPQAPRINTEQHSENTVGRQQPANGAKASLENRASNHKNKERSKDAPDVTFLGVKPGELLIAFITVLLWWSTQSLVREAKAGSERQLRAYVSAMTMKLSAVGETLTFHTFLKNHGHTPAYETIDASGVEILPFPMPHRYRFNLISDPADPVGKFVMYPGGEHKTTQTKILTDAQKRLLRAENSVCMSLEQ